MDKDTRKVLAAAEAQGFTWRTNRDGHPMVFLGAQYVTQFSGTPGDVRGIRNGIAAMRRHGFLWPPGRKPRKPGA